MTMDVDDDDDDDDGGGGDDGDGHGEDEERHLWCWRGAVEPLLPSWVHETQSPPKQLLDWHLAVSKPTPTNKQTQWNAKFFACV